MAPMPMTVKGDDTPDDVFDTEVIVLSAVVH